jgi:hypothetical protein
MKHFQSPTKHVVICLLNFFAKYMLLQRDYLQNLHYNRYNVLSQIFKMSILSTQTKIFDKNTLSILLIIRLLYCIYGNCVVQKAYAAPPILMQLAEIGN